MQVLSQLSYNPTIRRSTRRRGIGRHPARLVTRAARRASSALLVRRLPPSRLARERGAARTAPASSRRPEDITGRSARLNRRGGLTRVLYSQYDSYRQSSRPHIPQRAASGAGRGDTARGSSTRPVRVMATGLASLSVPAVAREAGVSVPTVYRHFGTKAELLAAMYPHAVRRAGLDGVPDPARSCRASGRACATYLRAPRRPRRPGARGLWPARSPTRCGAPRMPIARRDDSPAGRLDRAASCRSADRDRIARLLVVLTPVVVAADVARSPRRYRSTRRPMTSTGSCAPPSLRRRSEGR